MKTVFFTALVATVLTTGSALAQRFQQEALLIFEENRFERVWIADANKTQFLYFDTVQGVDQNRMSIGKPESIWLMEPTAYREAMELYQGRKYEEALERFQAVRESHIKLRTLPDNHSSLAAFYAMECLRKLDRLDDLAKAQETFVPDDRESLTRDFQLAQIELYTMWEAVRTKAWPRLELLCNDKLETKMPGFQRAQVGYCLGLALEGQNRPIPAINAYNIAMTADTGASEILTLKAAENALRLYQQDPLVQQAIRLWGTPEEDADSAGALRLAEAASLAALYQLTLGGGNPLPEESKDLIKYLPKENAAAAAEEKAPEPKKEKEAEEKPKEGEKPKDGE
ncbi:MAG: hypothetical protein AAGI48_08990 [Verrucomicrobiota bacterium]